MGDLTKKQILNLVAFIILMEGDKGIINKSPRYIEEKYRRYVADMDSDNFNWGLDKPNTQKLIRWAATWYNVIDQKAIKDENPY